MLSIAFQRVGGLIGVALGNADSWSHVNGLGFVIATTAKTFADLHRGVADQTSEVLSEVLFQPRRLQFDPQPIYSPIRVPFPRVYLTTANCVLVFSL